MKNFQERLLELRGSFTQNEMAKRIGIRQQHWARYENGETEPKIGVLVSIASAFGVSADWLLGLTDERTPRGGKPSVTASGVGAVAAGGSMRNVRTAQECQRCADKDATIARLSETVQSLSTALATIMSKGDIQNE